MAKIDLERENAELRKKLQETVDSLKDHQEYVKRVQTSPTPLAEVTAILSESLILDNHLELPQPKDLKVKLGDIVAMNVGMGGTMGIVKVSEHRSLGQVAVVDIVSDKIATVGVGGQSIAVNIGPGIKDLREGMKVILDRHNSVIMQALPSAEKSYQVDEHLDEVTWDMVGGLKEAKRALIEAVELPSQHPQLYKHYGKKPPRGILLHGSPGNGKTLLARALATSLRNMHGKKASATGFLSIRGPEVLSKWVGEAERTIRELFEMGEEHYRQHNYPATIFIDEADALLGSRGSNSSSHMEKTIVPQFLSMMDGLTTNHALVVIATNRPNNLDPAILRDGRIDRKVYVNRPSREDAIEIMEVHTKKLPFDEPRGPVVRQAVSWLFDSGIRFAAVKTDQGDRDLTMQHILSGAMIAGIVDKATSHAIHRNIAEKKTTGLLLGDFLSAINDVIEQNGRLDHTEALEEFAEAAKVQVRGTSRLVPTLLQRGIQSNGTKAEARV